MAKSKRTYKRKKTKNKKASSFIFSLTILLTIASIFLNIILFKQNKVINQQLNSNQQLLTQLDDNIYFQFEQNRQSGQQNDQILEVQVDQSAEYNFNWKNGRFTLFKNKQQVDDFVLEEKPLLVVVYKPTNTLAIVTSSLGSISDPHNLYLRHEQTTNLVYRGEKNNLAQDVYSTDKFYNYWGGLDNYYQTLASDFKFSPDGQYLLTDVHHYEGSTVLQIEVSTGKIIDNLVIKSFDEIIFSADSNCALNINQAGMYGPNLALAKNEGKGFIFQNLSIAELTAEDPIFNFYGNYHFDLAWADDCQAIIRFQDGNSQTYLYQLTTTGISPLDELAENVDFSQIEPYQEVILVTLSNLSSSL